MTIAQQTLMYLGWGLFALTLLFLSWREFMNTKMITSLIDRLQTRNLWEYKRTVETAGKRQFRKHTFKSDKDMAALEHSRLKETTDAN